MLDEPIIMIDPVYSSPRGLSKLSPAFLAPPSLTNTPRSSSDFSPLESAKMIQDQFEEIQVLRQDLTALNQKYILQIEQSDSAEQEKQKIESEIEDLSRRLFEQANEMVSREKKARHVAEKRQRQLESKLEVLAEDLENERAQLNELRIKFEKEQGDHPTVIENSFLSVHPLEKVKQAPSKRHYLPKSLDQKWLQLFTDFLEASQSNTLESLHRLPFLKLCMELDIEPCLKFGPTMKPKSHPLSIKRVLETVMHHPCFIEPLLLHDDDQKKRLSHSEIQNNKKRSSSSPPRRASFATFRFQRKKSSKIGSCHGCEGKQVMYRFKLKEQDTEWHLLDKTCRDQLVAVCDFYVFVRHVQSGLQRGDTHHLFQECLWLRLCMFWARSGVSL